MDRLMMPGGPVPPPFGSPPPGAMPGMPTPPGGMGQPRPSDPVQMVEAMRTLVGTPVKRPEPMYRPGYKPPKRPEPEQVRLTGKRLYDNNRLWRNLIYMTLRWVRQELTGSFPEDLKERQLGFQEEYISSALSDERNLIISKGAAHKPSFRATWTKDELRGYAQRLEDTVKWLRDKERFQSADGGNRPLELDEWALFTDYGMYVSRDTFAPRMTDCPVDMRLIDPCQVHPVWDRQRGLQQMYRVYWDATAEITAAYGDFTKEQKDKLEKEIGKIEDQTEHEVIEYWDTWYRCVFVGGVLMMAVTDHKYGDVPYTVQYGGHGEPMFTRAVSAGTAQRVNNQWQLTGANRNDERLSKAVPYLYYRLRGHEMYEAVMARYVTALKKDVNPPTIRYRTNEAAEKPMPQLNTGPGMQNEGMLGEEKIEALPSADLAKANMILQRLDQDRATGSAPPEMFGRIDKSNVTGVAQAGANDAGQHLLFPNTKAWEIALERRYDRVLRMLANFGEMSVYGNGEKKQPLTVPVSRRAKPGQPTAYEFDREVVEKVGSRVTVTFSRVDPRDWPGLAAAGKNMVDGGFALRREIRAIATGDHDYDTFYEEWMEENALFGALQLPEFQKLNVLQQLAAQIEENEGNPQAQAVYLKMAMFWMQIAAPPQQPGMPGQGQPGMPPQPGMPQQPQGPQALPGAPQQALQIPPQVGATPGVPGQMSYPAAGMPVGANGGQVGRPY